MDTRYWGPSGWRLLHLIAQGGRGPLKSFFETLPFVLPCKYCRQNLAEHIAQDPVPSDSAAFPRWLWKIHNAVNAKLREQHIPVTDSDPPFERVEAAYKDRIATGCSRTTFEGWEFLFSIADSHPFSRAAQTSSPIKGHPPIESLVKAAPAELNRWNLLPAEERMLFYARFWELLPRVFPFPEWTRAWKEASEGAEIHCRTGCLKGVWAIRRVMEEELELLNRTSYSNLCKELQTYRSGCSSAARGKTCRRKRTSK